MTDSRYGSRRSVMDFSLQSIAVGLEKALSEGCTIRREDLDDVVNLRAEFNTRERFGGCITDIFMDEKHGELLQTNCSCREFGKDYFQCSHIHTVIAKYVLDLEGEEGLRGSELEQKLKEQTEVEDPFAPGVLRKTDASLKDFLTLTKSNYKALDKPKWEIAGTKTVKEILSVDVVINKRENEATLELKVGPKRRYVIRDLKKLADAYQKGKEYQFTGSVKCPAGRSAYEGTDRQIMDFVSNLCQKQGDNGRNFAAYNHTDYYREVYISGRDLDALMEILHGKKLIVNGYRYNGKGMLVDLEGQLEEIDLSKTAYGAVLKMPDQECLACGMEWMYICQNEKVLRLPADQWEKRVALEEAMRGNKELYIQNKDLPVLCDGLGQLGMIKPQDNLEETGLVPYIVENPDIQIYLDYPQDDLITCQVKAHYPVKNLTVNILDKRKDKKKRNFRYEQEAGEKIWDYFSAYDENGKQMCLECDENRLFQFVTETIKKLAEIGEVFISDKLKKLKVHPAPEVTVGLQVEAGSLVMSLHSNLMSKEDMIQVLSSYRSKKKFTRLKNGEFVLFPESEMQMWETLADTYKTYGKKNPNAMKLPLFRALYLEEALRDRESTQLEEDLNYKQLVREIAGEEIWDEKIPESLAGTLREYQREGFLWINMLKKNGFGGILADDMGLGKTLQVLTFLLSQKEKGVQGKELRTLIVAPASLIYNWKKEIEVFTPSLSCQVVAGSIAQRNEILTGINNTDDTDIYITSYDLLKRDIALYEGITFANQIIDEAQYIKNQNTQVAKAVRLIESSFRLALTGTPIENRLSELWSIFDYLMPGFLFSYTRFRKDFEAPVINDRDEDILKRLRSMVHPFILRRLKKDVLSDLPDKIEETVTVVLEGKQRALYDAYAERLRLSLDKQSDEEFHQRKIEILAELTRLRQICCGPNVFLEDYKGESAKKETCMELVHQAIDGGHKILLFSQFTSVLDDLGARLKEEGITYHRIDGSVNKEQRMKLVDAFDQDEVPLFLISLKAGGTGLNLTAADIVIHYDPWWNLAAQNQATDRTHRIGQENNVTVYQLIAEKTIEEQIAILQKTKAQLAEDILEGEGIASIMINKEEILGLL